MEQSAAATQATPAEDDPEGEDGGGVGTRSDSGGGIMSTYAVAHDH